MRSLHIDTARTWRGGQNQVRLTVGGLAAAGHEVLLLAHAGGVLVTRAAAEGLPVETFDPRSEFDVQAAWRLGAVLEWFAPAVVHAHDPKGIALVAMALRMRRTALPAPLVVASRRVDFHLKRHAFSRWKYAHVDVFIAASRFIGSILERDGIAADRIEVVHDGVDIEAIDREARVDAHAAFWLPHGAPLVGNVAALAAHKGQRHLVTAATRVVSDVPDARIVIIGEGELREALDHQIKAAGLSHHVLLAGFRGDAIGLMKSFDLFVMSSVTEGLGSAILEAMACGRAVVAAAAGGVPEVVADGTTGLLVPPQDDAALATAIVSLLRDDARRERFGAAGRARVEREFGVAQLVDGTARVYDARHAAMTPR